MDKVRELETKLNEIVARFVNLEEIGFDDLNAAWKEIDEVKQILETEMVHACDLAVPLIAEVKQGTNWYEAK